MPLYLQNGRLLKTPGGFLAAGVDCCCQEQPPSCPDYCRFDLAVGVQDTINVETALTRESCAGPCNEISRKQLFFSPGGAPEKISEDPFEVDSIGEFKSFITAEARYAGNLSGLADVFEAIAVPNTVSPKRRRAIISCFISCLPESQDLSVSVQLTLTQNESLVIPEISYTRTQSLDVIYAVLQTFQRADRINQVSVVASGNGVLINGAHFNWQVNRYNQTCRQRIGFNLFTDCSEFLSPQIPTATFLGTRRLGC
jgi:hypothetical protein